MTVAILEASGNGRPLLVPVPDTALHTPTVSQFVGTWLAEQPHLREGSRVTYASWLRNHIDPLLGAYPIDLLGDQEVRQFALALGERLGGTTSSNVLTFVRAALDEACVQGYLARNPARSLPRWMKPRRGKPPRRILVEANALLDSAPPSSWERPLFATCIFAGLRSGEARGLCWRNLDFTANRICIRQQATGSRFAPLKTPTSERDVVLYEHLACELRAHRERSDENDLDLVFSFTGKIMNPWLFRRHLDAAALRAGIRSVTPHDLRRTFGSILIAAGADVTYVQRQMGHGSPAVTLNCYASLFDERRNVDAVATYVSRFSSPER